MHHFLYGFQVLKRSINEKIVQSRRSKELDFNYKLKMNTVILAETNTYE